MGAEERFVLWGPDHLVVLGITLVGSLWLLATHRPRAAAEDAGRRRTISVLLIVNEVSGWIWGALHGPPRIPLQLCDVAVGVTAWALWSVRPRESELAYFWGLAASLQAVCTPDLPRRFPDYWWMKFFLTHCGVVWCAVYLATTGRVRPTASSLWRVWGWTNLYTIIAGLINWTVGANLGYLRYKPSQPSLLDLFGPWPWYLAGMEVVAWCSFALAYVPFLATAHHRPANAP